MAWVVVHNDADRPQHDSIDTHARLSYDDNSAGRQFDGFDLVVPEAGDLELTHR